jgi:hypothetical protein
MDSDATDIGVTKEINSLIAKGVLKFILPSTLSFEQRRRIIPSKLFMKQKGAVMKARMVAGGHRQLLLPTEDTSSPTVMNVTVMALIQLVTTYNLQICIADVETAYLNADNTNEDIMSIGPEESQHFIRTQPHLAQFLDDKHRLICRIVKALYGLQQSSKLWYDHLKDTLHRLGYHPTMEDRCCFIRNKDRVISIILVFVDDLFIANNDLAEMSRIKGQLEESYPRMKFSQDDNFKYLGMEFSREGSSREITNVIQREYVKEILSFYDVKKVKPYPSNLLLLKEAEGDPVDVTQYLSLLMKLMYLAKRTRPDILTACSYLSTHCVAPCIVHWKQLIHILEYLNGTQDLGLHFTRQELIMSCYADASYTSHKSDSKSHTGIYFSLTANGPGISCFSLKQKTTAQSSAEAELIALHEGARATVWMTSLFKQMGARLSCPILSG